MPRKALLFDIGNVIVRFDFRPAAERFAEQSAASSDEVLAMISVFKDELESGLISSDDFITQSIERIGFRGTREDFVRIWGDIFSENEPMIQLIRGLHGKIPLYLLSNTSGLHKDWLFGQFDVFRLFDGGIYSHEARCMKPHEPIYHAAFKQLALEPSRTFYVDDLSANIVTGKQLGLVCHHYDPAQHERLVADLAAWLEA